MAATILRKDKCTVIGNEDESGCREGLHPEDIKAALRKRYGTLSAFSWKIGKSPTDIYSTFCRPGYSIPVERAVAEELGLKPQDIWPDRYQADGTPLPYGRRNYPKARAINDLRQNEASK